MAYCEKIDLHGETQESAKKKLQSKLKTLPADTRELIVIHGYHGGTALQEMVRKFKHPRVARVMIGLNNGETLLVINNKK